MKKKEDQVLRIWKDLVARFREPSALEFQASVLQEVMQEVERRWRDIHATIALWDRVRHDAFSRLMQDAGLAYCFRCFAFFPESEGAWIYLRDSQRRGSDQYGYWSQLVRSVSYPCVACFHNLAISADNMASEYPHSIYIAELKEGVWSVDRLMGGRAMGQWRPLLEIESQPVTIHSKYPFPSATVLRDAQVKGFMPPDWEYEHPISVTKQGMISFVGVDINPEQTEEE